MAQKNILQWFKKATASKRADPLKKEAAPYRDWRTVVIVFFVALAVSVGFNIYMSIEINRDAFFAATPKAEGGVKFDREGLHKVLDGFAAKEATFERLKTERLPVVDPSL